MAYDYGYGELENSLIEAFKNFPPDCQKAEELISQGADVNSPSKNEPDENILSEILLGYWDRRYNDSNEFRSPQKPDEIEIGESMVRIVRFFLDNGFSVAKNDYHVGAQCLAALVHSTHDEFMLKAACLLLDAGAKNTIAYSDDSDTALNVIGMEQSFQGTAEHDHHLSNLFEAYYQMVLAVDEGRPYQGINHYMKCYGKRINCVLATKPMHGDVFYDLDLPTSNHKNCFNQTLYFEYDGGYLLVGQYADTWTDTVLPDKDMVDVSTFFPGIVDGTVIRITFGHNDIAKGTTHYGQPIINLEMDQGTIARFTINFGEVESEDRAAYYSIGTAQ